MNVNFELFKIFHAVATTGSITKGAEKLRISQPAVTQSIKTLEDELGGILFVRTPKGVILTNEGSVLFDYIKDGMELFLNGINKFNSLKELDSGRITIGSTTSISENFLIDYLKEFNLKYPNVEVNIVNDLTSNLIRSLRNGSLDIVVGSYMNVEADIEVHHLADLNDIVVSGIKNDSFNEDNLILQKYPSVTRFNVDKYFSFKPKMEVVSHLLLTKLVINNFGQGIVTKEYIKNELNKSLFEVKTEFVIPKRKLGFMTKKGAVPSFSTVKFIEILKVKH